ncbi:MAG: GGDEF domain-containing protein [Chloroflexi bacterium]|nr:GGDEF domain-containing protein [Chloroflexota bacterium]MDL1942910.1 GGDEF domain-containing protein [Chloroflexi bacterium CFX2]
MLVMVRLNSMIERTGKSVWLAIGLLLLCGVAVADYITGSELSLSLFYLIPIAVFSLTVNATAGVAMAFISAAIWLFIELVTTEEIISFVHLWNTIIRLGFFLLPALLLRAVERESMLARTDFMTGAINNRYFNELLQREIDRSNRYARPFTVAFIDLDNFKTINDTFGHTFGDTVLQTIADYMKKNLRKTDLVARVGGDEFAILLPETDEAAARIAISSLLRKISDDAGIRRWPVTFSVGVLTMNAPSISVDKILSIVDKLMYHVKNNGKNNIKYATYNNT